MADGASNARGANAPLPAIRDRFVVVDDFLPLELAQAMRRDIDNHFAAPHQHQADTHQVWNYWFVPELYAYLRTNPEKVIAKPQVEQFIERLRNWSVQTLGIGNVTWPYLSLYVPGCKQTLHNDSANGRFGFVYSLTRNERRTSGGETVVHREGDPFRAMMTQPGAGRSFYDLIEPRFNRLVIFDDRMPHAVQEVEGVMDPVEGRFVLHGHLSEAGPAVAGALPLAAAIEPSLATIKAFAAARFIDNYQGLVSVQLDVRPDGVVSDAHLLLDRVIHPDPNDSRWPELARDLVGRLRATRYPATNGPSRLILPIVFGAPMAR